LKMIKRYKAQGINKHTVWVYEDNGRQLAIDQNHDVGGEQFHIFDVANGGGEGCGTIWYPTLEIAQKEVERLFSSGQSILHGQDSNLCIKCRNHYSPNTPKNHPSKRFWNKKPNICEEFKLAHSHLFLCG